MFNLPGVVSATVAILVGVQAVRWFLGPERDLRLVLELAFIPARYAERPDLAALFPPDDPARWWSFVTYGLLHAGVEHLVINGLWLVVFGSAVAWRFGAGRFLVLLLVSTAAGALAHLASHAGSTTPMVGASAGISGLTAAAIRFVFEQGGPFGGFRAGAAAFRRPATPFLASLRNPRVFAFIALWFGLTLVFGAGLPGAFGEGSVAWEAHIGGFVAGLALFPLLDPVPR